MAVGSLGAVIFGVWLAIALDGIEVWNGWVILAILLWAVCGPRRGGARTRSRAGLSIARRSSSRRGRRARTAGWPSSARTQKGLMLHSIATVATLLILVDMIWKPGA